MEWPDGKPGPDPTTGATFATEELESSPAFCVVKVLTHFVSPSTSAFRVHAEVETGDCIIDFTVPLVRVIDAGDTDFDEGSVMSVYAFNATNRALAAGQDAAQSEPVELDELDQLTFEIAGERWVQKQVGGKLAKAWDTIFENRNLSRTLLLTKGK